MAVVAVVELTRTTIRVQAPIVAPEGSAEGELEVGTAMLAELKAQTLTQQMALRTQAAAVAEPTQKISTLETVDPE
jgi:hypothetical protein